MIDVSVKLGRMSLPFVVHLDVVEAAWVDWDGISRWKASESGYTLATGLDITNYRVEELASESQNSYEANI